MQRFEGQSVQRGGFARDAVVAQAIGAIRGQFRVEQRARGGLLQRFHRRAGKREPRAQIPGVAVRSTNSLSQL